MEMRRLAFWVVLLVVFSACKNKPDGTSAKVNKTPEISPDYSQLTLPLNIAPLNFKIEEEGDEYFVEIGNNPETSVQIFSSDGIIKIPEKKWTELLAKNVNGEIEYAVFVKKEGSWNQFQSFTNQVSESKVDPYLYYRLLYPGYESWTEISIKQRSLESFKERTVVENNAVSQNCVNCHAFNQQNPDNFMFHMRGSMGGTYFVTDGDLEKFNLKTSEMENGAVYPRWHPSGRYVAFSSNKVVQQFHSMAGKKIEVSDLNSTLILFDRDKNEILDIPVNKERKFMDTYPEWSPDGEFLYFCRAAQIGPGYDYRDTRYDLYRVHFDPEYREFGEPELVFDASGKSKSVSFPRVSPDGKSLVFTYHDYGCFPIWHKEADLYRVNLENLQTNKLDLNSNFTDSYHSWSSNGRWMIFSSKRGDGLSARPYISYIDDAGKAHKPFILPQEDPTFYSHFLKTFNIPEFAKMEVSFTPGELRKAAAKNAVQPEWSSN
ncbi:cytochrome C biosynthesis protein [Maribellus comscasis]|uniref:Cytochrome C biosynthesis protein n=1 Tax=Maribellus comscasis TaxID=2681766 RepID=A0A6I6JHL5_9BACT|nr:PD40 domain-containing protein [Maribellus comscasis]QGY42365.1 cytochrome C biosynthesis protein [Maribellus comscasis]